MLDVVSLLISYGRGSDRASVTVTACGDPRKDPTDQYVGTHRVEETRDQSPEGRRSNGTEPHRQRGAQQERSHSKMRMSVSNEKGGPGSVWRLYIVTGVM